MIDRALGLRSLLVSLQELARAKDEWDADDNVAFAVY